MTLSTWLPEILKMRRATCSLPHAVRLAVPGRASSPCRPLANHHAAHVPAPQARSASEPGQRIQSRNLVHYPSAGSNPHGPPPTLCQVPALALGNPASSPHSSRRLAPPPRDVSASSSNPDISAKARSSPIGQPRLPPPQSTVWLKFFLLHPCASSVCHPSKPSRGFRLSQARNTKPVPGGSQPGRWFLEMWST